ncbi:hypothetical protein MBM09_09685 [Flaviramulus sp. BrNp1-15]|uniref:hypothetical protein n=1 Tax=Flaviramulus sp. BrNp1-15 TaxID=2916754 RepID=UPI001EE90D8E|nr:hypothetical protein [Flaviramulus sp. BrNp1-15]ULC58188.1 hypothetical protein MBM09_09685 [Flaviramulus sp. BrNp1-15]
MKKIFLIIVMMSTTICQSQFIDSFDNQGINGWFTLTGDGNVSIDFIQKEEYARILVDATKDKHNVWWALIKRDVTSSLDLDKLKNPNFELRVEAKIRVSHAPKRVNFMINTQRTTNYHKQLREFDIPDTEGWHTISMTTTDLDAIPGDTLYVQLAATDWGLDKYYVDVDYYRADIINVNEAEPDKGEPLIYHPEVADLNTFGNHLEVAHDGLINTDFPDVNFNDWHVKEPTGEARTLMINANQWAILRWDFKNYRNSKANGSGVLELTTQSVSKGGNYVDKYGEDLGVEFGKVRIIEIFEGNPFWDQQSVTYNSFMKGNTYSNIFNTQMIFDTEVSEEAGGKNFITLSRPVMQRLLDGTTKGILIRPLGAIDASFYASENENGIVPKLYFNVIE